MAGEGSARRLGGLAARAAAALRSGVWLLVAALVASNGLLLWKVRSYAREVAQVFAPVSRLGLYSLVEEPFPTATGGSVTLGKVPQHYLAICVFTRYDAPFYTSELESLGRLARSRPDIRVFGVMAFASPRHAADFGKRQDLAFQILADPVGGRLQVVSPPRRPWIYVLNVKQKRFLFSEPPAGPGGFRRAELARLSRLPR